MKKIPLFLRILALVVLSGVAVLLIMSSSAFAQSGGVGIGTATPNSSAVLDITVPNPALAPKGLLMPRLLKAQRLAIASPVAGLVVYQTDSTDAANSAGLYIYTGSRWWAVPKNAADNLGNHTATQGLNLQGNAIIGTGTTIGSAIGIGVTPNGGLNIGENTAGNDVAVGTGAGSHSSGGGNTFLGYQAGNANTTGSANYFAGCRTGVSNTTGSYNQFEGTTTGTNNTTGTSNFFYGFQSGNGNTTGNFNEFIGYRAGITNTAGTKNMAVGYLADMTTNSLSNATAIGFNAKVSQNNSMVLGGTGVDTVRVGIGVPAPQARLHVAGKIKIEGGSPGEGKVLTSDASGLACWQAVPSSADNLGNHTATQDLNLQANAITGTDTTVGTAKGIGVTPGGALNIGQNSSNNVLVGYRAGRQTSGASNVMSGSFTGFNNTTGTGNIFAGYQAGYGNTTGDYNLFIGYSAGQKNTTSSFNLFIGTLTGSRNTSGTQNQFVGFRSGESNTTGIYNHFSGFQSGNSNTNGSSNHFTGYQSGYANSSGSFNHFSGYQSGYNNTTGSSNYFSGYQSGYNNTTGGSNTFLGLSSGYNNTTGSSNHFIGYRSGQANTTGGNNYFSGFQSGYSTTIGSNNTFIGFSSGQTNRAGSNNLALGYQADMTSDSLTKATAIGYRAKVSQNNSMVLGGTGADTVKVGMGVTAPAQALEIGGRQAPVLRLHSNTNGKANGAALQFRESDVNNGFNIRHNNGGTESGVSDDRLVIERVLGGTATPAFAVNQLNGNVGIGTTNPTTALDVNGTTRVTEVNTPYTSSANMVAVAYGSIAADGTIQSSSGNFTLSKTGTGRYTITFTSSNLSSVSLTTASVGVTQTNSIGFASYLGGSGQISLLTFDQSGNYADRALSFTIFQP